MPRPQIQFSIFSIAKFLDSPFLVYVLLHIILDSSTRSLPYVSRVTFGNTFF